MNNQMIRIFFSILSLAVLLFNTSIPASASGSTFLSADLRIDQLAVKRAGDYRVKISATKQPTSSFPSYISGWLGIHLEPISSPSGEQLTQVGLMADQTGVYWFAYSKALIRCLEGTKVWIDQGSGQYQGCKGEASQFVQAGFYHTVELVNYGQDEWIARVYDTNEVGHDVAVISHPGIEIYDADINFEEAYIQNEDPYLDGAFVFYRPQYNTWQTGNGFVDWPASQGIYANYLYGDSANPSSLCPTHYAIKTMYDHPRAWFTGTGLNSGDCNATLFNELYIPLLQK